MDDEQDCRKIFPEWEFDHQQGCWVSGSCKPQFEIIAKEWNIHEKNKYPK